MLLAVFALSFELVHADTRIISQTAYDSTLTTSDHTGFKFTASQTATIQSIAVGVDASCGSIGIGQLSAGELYPITGFSHAGSISGGHLWTGSYTVTAGQTYYVIIGSTSGSPCATQVFNTVQSLTFTKDETAYIVDVNGKWVPYDISPSTRQLQYTICSDASCSLYPSSQTTGIDWSLLYFAPPYSSSSAAIATSSALWESISFASSTVRCDSGNIFSDGLCASLSYLFVPDPTVLNGFAELASTTFPSKFPFSWAYGLYGAVNSLSASSTLNFAASVLDMASLGIGSTTPIGNVLPNVTAISSSTITHFLPAGEWNFIQSLLAYFAWILLAFYVFERVKHRHNHV